MFCNGKVCEGEVEVFRLSPGDFENDKCYAYAKYTEKTGKWPNEKYYTTNKLEYLGNHVKSVSQRGPEGGAMSSFIDEQGKERSIIYDERTCFKVVDCQGSNEGSSNECSSNDCKIMGGKSKKNRKNRRKSKLRKSKKNRKNRKKTKRSR
jgi:hypothetical protein